jgi:hypothetical protein
MLLRFQFHEALLFLKTNDYEPTLLTWFLTQLEKVLTEEFLVSKGIPLQLCDIFLQELNKADGEGLSYLNLAQLLSPFLKALGTCRNRILLTRIQEKIFWPILENNATPESGESEAEETDDSSTEINYDPKRGKKWVDGGKLPPKTQKEVQKIIDQRFHFPAFNILLYC